MYGVRPGIDEALLSQGKSGFLTRPMRTLAAFSDDRMLTDMPGTRHGRLSKFNEPGHHPGDSDEDDTADEDSDNSSEPPHPSLLNLVKAAEEIERSNAADPPTKNPSQGVASPWARPPAMERSGAAAAEPCSSPSSSGAALQHKRSIEAAPMRMGSDPPRVASPAEPDSPPPVPHMAVPMKRPSVPRGEPRHTEGAGEPDNMHEEEYAIQNMHRRLLEQLKHTKLSLPDDVDFGVLDGILAGEGPGSFGWPDLHRPTARQVSPAINAGACSAVATATCSLWMRGALCAMRGALCAIRGACAASGSKLGKQVAAAAAAQGPTLESAAPTSPQELRLALCRDGDGGGSAVSLLLPPAADGAVAAALDQQRVADQGLPQLCDTSQGGHERARLGIDAACRSAAGASTEPGRGRNGCADGATLASTPAFGSTSDSLPPRRSRTARLAAAAGGEGAGPSRLLTAEVSVPGGSSIRLGAPAFISGDVRPLPVVETAAADRCLTCICGRGGKDGPDAVLCCRWDPAAAVRR